MIDRRALLLGVPAAASLIPASRAYGQTPARPHHVAVLSPSPFPADEIERVVLPELAKLGFVLGEKLTFSKHVGAQADLPALAREALSKSPDVVIASTNAAVTALLEQSRTVPIVMAFAGDDPIKAGLAQSLARPGGSVTGLTNQATELDGKNLSLLREAVPGARKVAILAMDRMRHEESIDRIVASARSVGMETHPFFGMDLPSYRAAFDAMRAAECDSLILVSAPEFVTEGKRLAQLALRARLPAIGEFASKARDGLLLGYGTNTVVFRKRAADFVARILRGSRPGDLPIEQPSVFEFAINLRTARELGLEIPRALLLRADEVIE